MLTVKDLLDPVSKVKKILIIKYENAPLQNKILQFLWLKFIFVVWQCRILSIIFSLKSFLFVGCRQEINKYLTDPLPLSSPMLLVCEQDLPHYALPRRVTTPVRILTPSALPSPPPSSSSLSLSSGTAREAFRVESEARLVS